MKSSSGAEQPERGESREEGRGNAGTESHAEQERLRLESG
jgi:hypothetical protein